MIEKIKNIRKELEELWKQYVTKYDPTKQHFEIGDEAYVCDHNLDIIEVVITDIESFKKVENDSGYIFYSYKQKSVRKIDEVKLHVKFYVWLYFLRYLKFRQPKIPPKFGPGHGELAGRGEELFKDKYEARIDYILVNTLHDLDDLIYVISGGCDGDD